VPDFADLHMHSRHSDGEWSPERLVRHACGAGLRAIALTDHDTLTGLGEAAQAGSEHGLEVLTGVEISTWYGGDFHLLGYGFDPDDGPLSDLFERARHARRDRARAMVERLTELGVPVTEEEVWQEAGDGAVGRPHVARALVRAGRVSTVREAFDRFLADGRPACVEKLRVTPAEAIALVHAAGGVVVVAHPGSTPPEQVEALAEAGLDGVEVHHSMHDAGLVERWEAFAMDRSLLRSGGTDFHGPGPNAAGPGAIRIPYERVEELRDRAGARRAAVNRDGGS
jgi:predicted metal-dependent phosphoesterase TrpH